MSSFNVTYVTHMPNLKVLSKIFLSYYMPKQIYVAAMVA